MKKFLVITLVVGVIGALSLGAYAYRGAQDKMERGSMMGEQRGGMMAGQGPMHKMGPQGQGRHQFCPCASDNDQKTACPRWNAQEQPGTGTAPQVITEDKAKEAAQNFITKYLPGYTIDKIEKNDRRPMYEVTLKGPNGAEMQMFVRGFDGQVMHVFPKAVEKPAEPATQPAEK